MTKFRLSLFRCLAGLLLLTTLSATAMSETTREPFQWIRTGPGLSLHKEMFMLPATISDEYNGEQTEAVFQISAKHRIFGTRFYFAYTQISFWQAWDHNHSAPFRETNYNPEIFYRLKPMTFRSGRLSADLGLEHESNGQRPPESRSWNLLYVAPYFYQDNFLLYLKLRYRFPEDDKEFPGAFVGDDNPDITDYLGHADFHLFYKLGRRHSLHFRVQGSLKEGRGGVCATYSLPVPKSEMSFFSFRLSHGYGESMVDYKRILTRFGVGIMFNR